MYNEKDVYQTIGIPTKDILIGSLELSVLANMKIIHNMKYRLMLL